MKLAGLLAASCLILNGVCAAAPVKQFVVVSDIHFNPLADPLIANQLMEAEPSQWDAIFAQDAKNQVQHYQEDTTWNLLSALVSGLQKLQPKPGMIVVTGDILPHKFQEKFFEATKSNDKAEFSRFIIKTFQFVSLKLQAASGASPVVYTLGNNDQECGDYALEPGGPFLRDTSEAVQNMAHIDGTGMATWKSLGSYVLANQVAQHGRIIALNSNFWSRRYTNACGAHEADPGAAVLSWLAGQLKDAQERGDKVWLVYHIPPGIDGHTSFREKKVTSMWKQPYSDGFDKLLDRYRKTIQLQLAAHTHLDDIRLVQTEHATSIIFLIPGVSPNVGQNPAFRVMTLNSAGTIQDSLTYYVLNVAAPEWQLEYSARKAYKLRKIDARSYQELFREIGDSPATAEKWRHYYGVSQAISAFDDKDYWRSLYCATGNAAPDSFRACLSSR